MRHSAVEKMGLEMDISRQTKWGGEGSQQRKSQRKVTELRGHRAARSQSCELTEVQGHRASRSQSFKVTEVGGCPGLEAPGGAAHSSTGSSSCLHMIFP